MADRVEFASITTDPQRDTPARLGAYRTLFAPAPADRTLLTGSASATAALWTYLGVYYQKVAEDGPAPADWMTSKPLTYDINHADLIFFVDGGGHERFAIDGAAHVEPGTQLPALPNTFLSADGRRNLTDPDAGTWTVPQALQVIGWLTNRKIGC